MNDADLAPLLLAGGLGVMVFAWAVAFVLAVGRHDH